MNAKNLLDATSWSTKYVSYALFALAMAIVLFTAVFGVFMDHFELKELARFGLKLCGVGLVVYFAHCLCDGKFKKVV